MSTAMKFGAALAAMLSCLLPAAAQAKWLRAESPHFIVYANSGEGTLRDYVQGIEDYDRLLRRMHKTLDDDAGSKLEIYLVNGGSDLRQVFPEMKGQWAGVYTSSPEGIFAVAFKPSEGVGNFVVKHEYYHHFMLQNFPGGYPAWMVEGMADFFSSSGRRGGKTMIGGAPPGRLETLAVAGWLPLGELISKRSSGFKPNQTATYYAEAWLLTNYMMTDLERRKQLIAYVNAVRGGEDSVKAWTEKVGEAPEVTQKKLHTMRMLAFVLDKDPPKKVEISVSPMPASADDMLLEGQQLKHGGPIQQGEPLLADIRLDAAKYPGDRLADLVLARAEIELGDPAAATPLLKRRLEADGADVDARLLQAKMLMRQADKTPDKRTELYREADLAIVPALKAHPRDFRLLYAYAQTRSVEPGYPSANMVTVLDNAAALAPQVEEIRFAAADACAYRGDFDHAIELLRPVASDPHQPGAASAARAQIERLEARKAEAAADHKSKP